MKHSGQSETVLVLKNALPSHYLARPKPFLEIEACNGPHINVAAIPWKAGKTDLVFESANPSHGIAEEIQIGSKPKSALIFSFSKISNDFVFKYPPIESSTPAGGMVYVNPSDGKTAGSISRRPPVYSSQDEQHFHSKHLQQARLGT